MDLIVGVDSYVTAAQADAYVAAYRPAGGEARAAWEALSVEEKEAFLRRAAQSLERLSWRGQKERPGQPMAFPRKGMDFAAGAALSQDEGAVFAPSIPRAICQAQVEEALEMAAPTEDTQNRAALVGAVESYSIGGLSETFRKAGAGSAEAALSSARARELVAAFAGGGFEVR